MRDDKAISKYLSYVLRHAPETAGLELDPGGWAPIADVIAGAEGPLTEDQIRSVVASSDKQRFSISEDGLRIRANQGHSVPVDLGLIPQTPPDRLYHGTVEKFLAAILEQGLLKGQRHHVHLSADLETAMAVGARRGKPVILTIDAAAMAAAGHAFFRSENGVWLTDAVPAEFLARLETERILARGPALWPDIHP